LTITQYRAQEGIPWADQIDSFDAEVLPTKTLEVADVDPNVDGVDGELERSESVPTEDVPSKVQWPGVNATNEEEANAGEEVKDAPTLLQQMDVTVNLKSEEGESPFQQS
jgi:hypothetical protein